MKEDLLNIKTKIKSGTIIFIDELEDIINKYNKNNVIKKLGKKLIGKSIFRKDYIDNDEDRKVLLIYINQLIVLLDIVDN